MAHGFTEIGRQPSREQVGEALYSLDTLRALGRAIMGASESPIAQAATLPMMVAQPGGVRNLRDLIGLIARQRGRSQPSMIPDLTQAGLAAAIERFKKKFPGTDPEIMETIGATETPGRQLAAAARGGIRQYMAKNIGPVEEPQTTATARGNIRKWESLLEQKFGGGFISDEAIARGSKLPLDTVRQLRADPGYRASIDPITGALFAPRDPTEPTTLRRIPKALTTPISGEGGPPASLDPIRDAMARTPLQKQILELYERAVNIEDIAGQLKMPKGNVRAQLDRMIERGKRETKGEKIRPIKPTTKPISGGAPAEATYRGYQEGFRTIPGFHMYDLVEDIRDPKTGMVVHPKGSTVSAATLDQYGIPYKWERSPYDGPRRKD